MNQIRPIKSIVECPPISLDLSPYRISNLVVDTLARGGAVEFWTRGAVHVVTVTHPSRREPHHCAGSSLTEACDRAARVVARLPVRMVAA